MARPPSTHPTDGELENPAGSLAKRSVQPGAGLQGPSASGGQSPPPAVATNLGVMLDKRLVRRRQTPQGYLWSARTTRQNAAGGMVRKLVDLVFDGSAQRLVAHLLESGQFSDRECEEIQKIT